MSETVPQLDFDAMSWHDNIVYGLRFDVGDARQRFPERDYYRWRIELNLPQGGEIAFGARGFTQVLRAEPVLPDEQWLPAGSPR